MITKRRLWYWVKSSNLKLQAVLLLMILVTVGARVLPLEMQKRIVNQAIRLQKMDLLLWYCAAYLAAVLLASGLKYLITLLQTRIGQQALARMRKELYAHILRLPLSFFQKSSPGMVVSSILTELATAGEFVGQAVAVPVTNLLTLLAFGAYMFWLNPLLALLSLASYPVVIIVVPLLQRRSNQANKERVDTGRKLSSTIDEVVSGIHEVHGNGSYALEERKFNKIVDELLRVRIVWMMYKGGAKVLNNFFQNLGPFLLFLVGGWLAINGRFDLGALVAFLSAYEKLYDPWKELMDFYQVYQDAKVGYSRIMEYFDGRPEHRIEPEGRPPMALQGAISASNVSFTVSGGIQLLKQVNLDLKAGDRLALVGFSGSGKSTLARCICQLYKYTGGSILVDGNEVSDLAKMDMAHNVGIVSQSPFIFDGTIKENLLYSCEAVCDEGENGAPGANGRKIPDLDASIQAIQEVGLFVDVLRFGLNAILKPDADPELIEKLVRVRLAFQETFGKELADYFEFFDEKRFLSYSPVSANLIFGNSNDPRFTPERLPQNQFFLEFLKEAQLKNALESLGRDIAVKAADILGNMPPDEVFFRQSPIPAEEFQATKGLAARCAQAPLHEIAAEDRLAFLKLALRFIPGKHRLANMPDLLEKLVLDGRALLRDKLAAAMPGTVSFYHMSEYIHSQAILENILFGKPKTDHPKAQEKISQSIIQLLIEEDLLERIVEIGMDFNVGTKGDRLSGGQRQKLAIARAFLKGPPILIMDEATSALDNASQQRIQNLLDTRWKGKSTVIAVVHRLDTIKTYDKIAVMKAGKIVEMGPYDELMAGKGILYGLIHGARAGI